MKFLLGPFKPYLYGLLGIFVIGAGIAVLYYKYQYTQSLVDITKYKTERDNALVLVEAKQKEIELKKQEIKIMEGTLNFHMKQISQLKKDKEKTDDLLNKALKNNRDWSDSRLPDELRKQFEIIQS